MKSYYLVFFTFLLLCMSCGEKKVQRPQVIKNAEPNPPKEISTENEDDDLLNEAPAINPTKDFGSLGMDLLEKESIGNFKLGMAGEAVEKIIGPAEKKTAWEFWGADAAHHQEWTYQKLGLGLGMVKEEDQKISLERIMISAPSKLKTKRGIRIGSSRAEVLKIYQSEIETPNQDDMLLAGSIYGGLLFYFDEDHKVNEIQIGAFAE